MDFVVIGLGLSALALLTGLALLCMVAPRWFRKSRAVQPADAAYARALAGVRQALGQGFLCVGAVLLLATIGGISAGLADKAGAYLIASMTTVAALGLFGWDLLYRRQHPVPQRRRVTPARAKPAAAEASTSLSGASADESHAATATRVRRRVLPARQRAAETNLMVEVEPGPEGEPPRAAGLEIIPDVAEPQATAGSEPEPEPGDHEPAPEPGTPEEPLSAAAADTGEMVSMVSEETVTQETAEVIAEFPEPVPSAHAQANGAADLAASSVSEPEPHILPDGDDKVIALFPTAGARRSRMTVVPTDPDGKS